MLENSDRKRATYIWPNHWPHAVNNRPSYFHALTFFSATKNSFLIQLGPKSHNVTVGKAGRVSKALLEWYVSNLRGNKSILTLSFIQKTHTCPKFHPLYLNLPMHTRCKHLLSTYTAICYRNTHWPMKKLKSKPNNLKCHQIKDIILRLPTIVLKTHFWRTCSDTY